MNRSSKVHRITLTAILMAVILLMSFTPLGYLRVGIVSITFLAIPVVIGAILLGPMYGGLLGAVFGLTSFAQCFGMDVFGTTLMGINPIATFVVCLIPRVLIGVIAGLLYRLLRRWDRAGLWSAVVTAVVGSLTNTVFFIGMVILFFQSTYFGGQGVLAIILAFFSINIPLEAVRCGLLGGALSRVFARFLVRD